ncbi:uncharacterized protein IL334_005028 [Kwoniella shivajii]|uniref:Fcf2 pre-rRNA processing C-terminal domain-containing protein n=1 Tax=Kwoniella shivajii TaxID=564305 RepID=A0ABZ1D2K8_9TREE|nr:hypothetical protein IL334_005028 [Kwoniella shivajii]
MTTPKRASRPSTPSSSNQPTPTPARTPLTHTHHKTADELAAEEAASILHTPTARLRASGSATSVGSELETGSARALRHRRLNEVREAAEGDKEDSKSITSETSKSREGTDDENDDASKLLDGSVQGDGPSGSIVMDEEEDIPPSAGLSTGQIFAPLSPSASSSARNQQSVSDSQSDEDDEDDGSSTVSASSSSSASSSNTSDSEDEDDSDDEQMERLLQAAKAAAIAKSTSSNGKGKERADTTLDQDDEVVLQFDEDQVEKKKDAPIPDLSVPTLPRAHLSFTKDGKALAHTRLPEVTRAGPSRPPIEGKKKEIPVPELDDRPYERQLSKREKAAQPRKATTSELWASIPTPRSDFLPQMKRDYQALALANSLDPKRFMKGGSRSDKIPESFAIGTMVDAPRHLQDTTLTKERKYRAGQVVQGLIMDDGTGEYAKRKYGDLQWSRMENGRGKSFKKNKKW